MKKSKIITTCFASIFISFYLFLNVHAETMMGHVFSVADGDTLTIQESENAPRYRIRLLGIDAPELAQTWGQEALDNLQQQIENKTIKLVSNKKDRYGRLVAQVFLNGKDIALAQLRDGFAWYDTIYAHELNADDQIKYREAYEQAQRKKIGLWQDRNPTPPWTFRRMQR